MQEHQPDDATLAASLKRLMGPAHGESDEPAARSTLGDDGWLAPLVPRGPRSLPAEVNAALDDAVSLLAGRNPERTALAAGLLLLADRLDESHRQSQTIENEGTNRNGDYWHAIMHRREPDYGNSKYWFRAVGRHPIFDELARVADAILSRVEDADAGRWRARLGGGGAWNPAAFVDLCSACADDEDTLLGLAARRIQRAEMLLLLDRTSRDAGLAFV